MSGANNNTKWAIGLLIKSAAILTMQGHIKDAMSVGALWVRLKVKYGLRVADRVDPAARPPSRPSFIDFSGRNHRA